MTVVNIAYVAALPYQVGVVHGGAAYLNKRPLFGRSFPSDYNTDLYRRDDWRTALAHHQRSNPAGSTFLVGTSVHLTPSIQLFRRHPPKRADASGSGRKYDLLSQARGDTGGSSPTRKFDLLSQVRDGTAHLNRSPSPPARPAQRPRGGWTAENHPNAHLADRPLPIANLAAMHPVGERPLPIAPQGQHHNLAGRGGGGGGGGHTAGPSHLSPHPASSHGVPSPGSLQSWPNFLSSPSSGGGGKSGSAHHPSGGGPRSPSHSNNPNNWSPGPTQSWPNFLSSEDGSPRSPGGATSSRRQQTPPSPRSPASSH